jgi:PAS domain S-box-containing protein
MARAAQQQLDGDALDKEYRLIRLDGELRWLHCQSFPIVDGAGRVVRLVGTVADISDRKQAEAALAQAEERYRRATQAARAGVWELNTQTGLGYLDPSIKALAGYGEADMIDDLNSWMVLIHPDDQEPLAESIQTYISGVTPSPGKSADFVTKYRLLHRDGSAVWVLSRGQLSYDDQGQPAVFYGTTTDITQLKQTEVALQQLNDELEQRVQQRTQDIQKLAALVENSTDFISKKPCLFIHEF